VFFIPVPIIYVDLLSPAHLLPSRLRPGRAVEKFIFFFAAKDVFSDAVQYDPH